MHSDGKSVLRSDTIGHSAAYASVLGIGPETELIVVMARIASGNDHDRHGCEFRKAVEESLEP